MSRKARNIIITLGILLLLCGAYFGSIAYRNRQFTSRLMPFTPTPRLGNLQSSELVKIEIPGITLERKGDIWELVYLEGGIPPGIELDQREIQGMLFPLSNMWIDRTIEEEPANISIYGFDTPSSRVILTDSAGSTQVFIRGDMTPSRIHYYAMREGDPAVYAVPAFHGELMSFTLDSIRSRSLFTLFSVLDVDQLRIESPGTRIELISKPADVSPRLSVAFSTHILTSPYSAPWGVDPEALHDLLVPLANLQIEQFINNNPSSLAPYGLDQATRIFIQTTTRTLDLLIGSEVDGEYYAKLADAPGVFTVSGIENVVNVRPFALIDKFTVLIDIGTVDRLTVTGGGRRLTAEFQGMGQDAVFFLNGRQTETRSFRTFYLAIIGLLVDAEYSGPGHLTQSQINEEITIEFLLNSPAGERVSITLFPYNRDFYLLRQEGAVEFLLSVNQVRRIFETADAVVFE
jgi:hypothetical protein